MKMILNLKSGITKAVVMLMSAAFAVVSCYDDSGLQEQIDLLTDKVYELEQKMNDEIKALKAMLAGNVLISDVSTNASTGVTTITLTDGLTIELLPQQDLKSYVTYMVLGDGKNYWAYIGEDGAKHLFLDEKEKPIPVTSDVPKVITQDGDTYLVIGGTSYPISGNSVFSDYVLHADELTGEVYAVTFTFGDDMTFTVAVDGASGFYFVKNAGWATTIATDWYVANGVTERIQVDKRGVVDYVLQIPDGWRVKEYEDVYMGTLYFDITAPSKELINEGIAAAEGDLKVVAVLEGGKATVARLYLTTNPFKSFGVSLGNVRAEMFGGLQKFVYGICAKNQFDETTVFETASSLLEAYDYPSGYGVSTSNLFAPVVDVLGVEPSAGTEYVFWAIPALYYQAGDSAGYYLAEDTFVTHEFKYSSLNFEIYDEMYRDATLDMDIVGVEAYYMQLVPASGYLLEDVLYRLNSGACEALTSPMKYVGSVFEFAELAAEPASDYVAWIAIAEPGKIYTEEDLIVREFSTLKLVSGGSIKVVEGEVSAAALDIKVPLAAEGAETIYYTFMTVSGANKYADDAAKADYLFEEGICIKGTSVEAKLSDVITKAKPSTSYVLIATASDSNGKYGPVLTLECATTAFVYNDMKVKLELAFNDPGNVQIAISAAGSDSFLYWIGKVSDNTWRSSTYLGGSAATAETFMYQNPTHTRFTSVMERYPVVDNKILLTDLSTGVDYVIVAMAKAADGTYSHAVDMKFTTRAVSIGKVVLSSDSKWAAAKPTIDFIKESFSPAAGMMPGQYSANVTIPMGYTGYVLLGTDAYFTEGEIGVEVSVEEKIQGVITYADAKRDVGVVVDEDAWVSLGYPNGYEFYHFPHGSPSWGNRPGAAVIWGSEEFHNSRCDCLVNPKTTTIVNGVEMPVTQVVLINDGQPVKFAQPSAIGSTTEVIDRVFVVCQDAEGNCYQTYEFDVPFEYFRDATSGE